MANEEMDALAIEVLGLSEAKRLSKLKMDTLSRKIEALKRNMKEIEMKIAFDVAMEKGEDGKAIYTNEKMRDTETYKRLLIDNTYPILQQEEKEADLKLAEERIWYDYHNDRFRAIEIYTDIKKNWR